VFVVYKHIYKFKYKGIKMKRLLSIVMISAVFALVGCSAQKGPSDVADTGFAQVKETCKGKKCKHHRHHHGKLGVEKTTQDTAK
jgi:hypothetical protein